MADILTPKLFVHSSEWEFGHCVKCSSPNIHNKKSNKCRICNPSDEPPFKLAAVPVKKKRSASMNAGGVSMNAGGVSMNAGPVLAE